MRLADTLVAVPDTPSPPRGRTATTLRIAAAVWLFGAVVGVAIDLWQQTIWAEHEAGAELEGILERIRLSSWLAQATHFLSTATVAVAASAWARGRPLVRVGQGLLGLSLLLGVWLLIVRMGQSSIAEIESLESVGTINGVVFFVGLAALLAPTRAPRVARVGFGVLAAAWLLYLHAIFDPATSAPPSWLFSALSLTLAGCWSAGLWLGAAHEFDEPVEAAGPAGVDDPARLLAADGLALLRTGIIARIVLGIGAVAMLVAVRADPGASGSVVWLAALGHCVLAVILAVALTRYGSLPDRAVERGHVTTVIACLAVGAMLELYAASQAAALFDVVARASDGTSLWGMPRLSELEAMEARTLWTGRIATLVGIVGAVSLGISLRQTALWLDDFRSGDRASTLVVMTILGGGAAGVLVAAAQSGAVRDLGAIVAAMLAALTLAVAILVMWMRLLGGLIQGLRRTPAA